MAPLKYYLEKFNKWIPLVFLLTVYKVWGILKPLFTTDNMDEIKHYYYTYDWSNCIPTILLIIACIGMYFENRKEIMIERADKKVLDERLSSLENFVRIRDEQEMNEEILHAVCWWIVSLNKTQEDISEYIHHYFPRNEQKIINYLNNKPG